MWNHNLTLLVIMLLAGGFGGTVNHLLDKRGKREGHSLLRSIFIGTAASLLVPLFLNMISSTLLAQSAVDDEKLFVFSGFCIIAAISSSAFIRRISAKVLQEVQVLQKNVQDTRAGLDLLLDVHMEPEYKRGSSPATTNALPLAESAIAVLRSLTEGRFALRSAEGISRDSGLGIDQITADLDLLASMGLIRRWDGDNGTRWSATPRGSGELL